MLHAISPAHSRIFQYEPLGHVILWKPWQLRQWISHSWL